MSDIELVVSRSRRLEALLKSQFHAEGKGLHQLINSVEERLPHDIIKKLRYIATIRNKVVHEEYYTLDDPEAFKQAARECEKELTPNSGRIIWGVAIALVILLTGAALVFYYNNWHAIKLD
ncbi:hypothetical protein ST37_05205 [Vibrio sp. qd031]|uniref:DUF4145 domain-containing protein n=1 Tax=Vibrio sp. qd031 TaxID=1603038 RepID=UPI000A1173C6|nr:DUF4145 domain-containing protein [Vibrio sp. qd031]ORT51744.1 hypothetical protein ST37_05205 [Vibrio sp. qd031]